MMQKSHYQVEKASHQKQIILMAENIRTPENVGMLLRLADAFGVQKVYFAGPFTAPISTKAKRASRNTVNTMPFEVVEQDYTEIPKIYEQQGFLVTALEITDQSGSLRAYKTAADKVVLLLGAERNGISEELLQTASLHLHISLYGKNSSLNVAHACAIALYELTSP